jgi:hypothetical protein
VYARDLRTGTILDKSFISGDRKMRLTTTMSVFIPTATSSLWIGLTTNLPSPKTFFENSEYLKGLEVKITFMTGP